MRQDFRVGVLARRKFGTFPTDMWQATQTECTFMSPLHVQTLRLTTLAHNRAYVYMSGPVPGTRTCTRSPGRCAQSRRYREPEPRPAVTPRGTGTTTDAISKLKASAPPPLPAVAPHGFRAPPCARASARGAPSGRAAERGRNARARS